MKALWKYLAPYKGALCLCFAMKFISALTEMLIPSMLKTIVDDIIPQRSIPLVFAWGGGMVACALFAMYTNVKGNRLSEQTAGAATETLRHDLFAKISSLSAAQIDYFTMPSLISRLTSDSYNVNRMVARLQRIGVRAPILLLSGLCITITLDATLSLVLAAMLPFVLVLILFITRYSVPVYTAVQKKLDHMVRTVQENVTGVRVVKAFGKQEYERQRFDRVNTALADREQRGSTQMAFISPSTTLILNLGLTLLVFVGARRVNSGLTQTGTIIAFLSYFTIILDALLGISKIFLIGSKGAASANRIAEVLEAPEDLKVLAVDEPSEEGRQAPVGLRDTPLLTFDHVTFSYNKVESNVEDLSFSLQAGQTLGIIGPTGSGKSTILNLLLRLYDPDKGTIRIKGRDIRTMEPKALHALFGVVFQNDFLMQGTIRENLDYGRGLSDDALWRAAELAQAADFIREKGGLDAMLEVRAANLSGGQRQRLFIARAIARKPEILVLDDSSSALDYQTDAALRHALHHQHSRLVQVIVAQRVSAIAGADLILVMDDGKVLAAGTHETLYETCPAYREITDIQMGGLRHA